MMPSFVCVSDPVRPGAHGLADDADDHSAGVEGTISSPMAPAGLALLHFQTIKSARLHQNHSASSSLDLYYPKSPKSCID